MKKFYTNDTEITQIFHDRYGDPVVIPPGETVEYDSPDCSIDEATVKAETDDGTGAILYIGYAAPGTAEGAPGWAIKKRFSESAGGKTTETYLWAGGGFKMIYKWTERTTQDYS